MNLSGFNFDNDYYKNSKYFDEDGKETVLVWVEDSSDSKIWSNAFPKGEGFIFEFQTTDMFDFGDGVVSTGCDRIGKLIKDESIELGKNIIVCMDSDYHKMMNYNGGNKKSLLTNPYVYLTIFHSIENLKHYSSNLDLAYSRSLGTHVSALKLVPSDIAIKLSNVIFSPLSKYLYLASITGLKGSDHHNKHKGILKTIKFISKVDPSYLSDNNKFYTSPHWLQGVKRLADIDVELSKMISSHGSSTDYNSHKSYLIGEGFNIDNAYLFLRGHDVEDFFHSVLDAAFDEFLKGKISRVQKISDDNSKSETTTNQRITHIKNTHFKYSICSENLSSDIVNIPMFKLTCDRLKNDYS